MLLLGALGCPPLAAQGFRVTGGVVRVSPGGDSIPLARHLAVLHRVAFAEAGPVDSGLTDGAGRYTLRAPVLDTSAAYVVSLEFQGIAYFTTPLHTFGEGVGAAAPLLVYDTSSTAPPIQLVERHVVIRTPGTQGARRVIELLVLANRGTRTRVVADTSQAVWQGAIPPSAVEFEVGESDVSAQAVIRRGNAVTVTAPIPPGTRQLLVSYLIPNTVTQLRLPVDQPVARLNVLLEDTAATVEGALESRGKEELEDLVFRRFAAENVVAGIPVLIHFAPRPLALLDLWWVLIPLVIVTLIGGFLWWWRRGGSLAPVEDAERLAAQIAALDLAYAGREDEEYRKRREALKARLTVALEQEPGRG